MIEEKITILKNESKEIKADKTKLKEQIQIQEDRSRRKNIQVDIIEENESGMWFDSKAKLKSFLYDKFEILGDLCIERAHRVTRKGYTIIKYEKMLQSRDRNIFSRDFNIYLWYTLSDLSFFSIFSKTTLQGVFLKS